MKKRLLVFGVIACVHFLTYGMEDRSAIVGCGSVLTHRMTAFEIYDDYLEKYEDYATTRQVDLKKIYTDINKQDEWGDTLLHKAVESKNIIAIKELLSSGARCDIVNALGQSPLSLALSMENQEKIIVQKCFKEQGCFFVHHGQEYSKNIPYLLQDEAEAFCRMIENMNSSEKMTNMMLLFCKLFKKAEKNEYAFDSKGYLVQTKDSDCFFRVKLSDLRQWYSADIVNGVYSVVFSYCAVPEFMRHCNEGTYQEAARLLQCYPLLVKDERFNRYIMFQLLSNTTKECWQFLLQSGFSPNCSHMIYCTVLHKAAALLHEHALYYLVYGGADCYKRNQQFKTAIDMLFEYCNDYEKKHNASNLLSVVMSAMRDRINWLMSHFNNDSCSLEIQRLRLLEDDIRRFVQNIQRR